MVNSIKSVGNVLPSSFQEVSIADYVGDVLKRGLKIEENEKSK